MKSYIGLYLFYLYTYMVRNLVEIRTLRTRDISDPGPRCLETTRHSRADTTEFFSVPTC